jgi:hypothetical protein
MPDREAQTLSSKAVSISLPGGRAPYIPPEAGSFKGMLGVLNDFIDREQGHLDDRTKQEARTAGALAGLNADFKPEPPGTIANDAYNQAAYDTFINRTVTDSLGKLDELHVKHARDPVKMDEAGRELGASIAGSLPDGARAGFLTHYLKNLGSYVRESRSNMVKDQTDEHKASFENAEFILHNKISSAAEKGDMEVANTNLGLYLAQLDRNGPAGTRALTSEQVAEKQRKAMQTFEHSVITGEFARAPDKLGYIQKINADPKFRDLYDDKQRKAVTDGLYSQLNQQLSMQSNLRSLAKQQREDTMGRLMVGVINDPKDEKAFELAQKYATVNGMEGELLKLHRIKSGDEGREDAALVKQYLSAVRRGGMLEDGSRITEMDIVGKVGSGIRKGTANELMSTLQQVRDGGTGHFTNWEDFKQAARRVKSEFPTRVDAMGRVLSEDIKNADTQGELDATLFDIMDYEYKAWVEGGMKPSERPDPRQKINLMIRNEKAVRDGDKENAVLREVPSQFRSGAAVKAARESGQLTQELANKYYKALEKAGMMGKSDVGR